MPNSAELVCVAEGRQLQAYMQIYEYTDILPSQETVKFFTSRCVNFSGFLCFNEARTYDVESFNAKQEESLKLRQDELKKLHAAPIFFL